MNGAVRRRVVGWLAGSALMVGLLVASSGCKPDATSTTPVETDLDTDTDNSDFFDIPECMAIPSDHAPHPICDPTSTMYTLGEGIVVETEGCMMDGSCYLGPNPHGKTLDDLEQVVWYQRSQIRCCSQDGVAYRYVTFSYEFVDITAFYDDDGVERGFKLDAIRGQPTPYICLDSDSIYGVNVFTTWRGKVLDHCEESAAR